MICERHGGAGRDRGAGSRDLFKRRLTIVRRTSGGVRSAARGRRAGRDGGRTPRLTGPPVPFSGRQMVVQAPDN